MYQKEMSIGSVRQLQLLIMLLLGFAIVHLKTKQKTKTKLAFPLNSGLETVFATLAAIYNVSGA